MFWTAITKYNRLFVLNNRYLFLKVLKSGKPKIEVSANLVPDEDPLPSLQRTAFLLRSHTVKEERKKERESALCFLLISALTS